jgi:hypothetical protein
MGSQPRVGQPVSPAAPRERRAASDRRRRVFWSIAYGNFKPRRRNLPRRVLEYRFHHLDWHPAHLLFVAIVILLLSVGDAFLTLGLLSRGANEINPVMALVVRRDASVFTAIKMALTGASVVCMVFLARYRFMRRIRVELALYGVLLGYVWLIDYELRMVEALGAASIF